MWAIARSAAPPALVLPSRHVMFLYGIGIRYGAAVLWACAIRLKWNALAAAGVLCALTVASASAASSVLSPAHTLGMFAGALTIRRRSRPPSMRPASSAAVGYSSRIRLASSGRSSASSSSRAWCGPAWSRRRHHPRPSKSCWPPRERARRLARSYRRPAAGRARGDGSARAEEQLPDPSVRLDAGDGLLMFGEPAAIDQAQQRLGRTEVGRPPPIQRARHRQVSSARGVDRLDPVGGIVFPDGIDARSSKCVVANGVASRSRSRDRDPRPSSP